MLFLEVPLLVDSRYAAFGFLGLLALVALALGGVVIKSMFDQRKYSKAALPSLTPEATAQETTAVELKGSAFNLDDLENDPLEDISTMTQGDEQGTSIKDLPGRPSVEDYQPRMEAYEPEETALPSLMPGHMPSNGTPEVAESSASKEEDSPADLPSLPTLAEEEPPVLPRRKMISIPPETPTVSAASGDDSAPTITPTSEEN